MGVAAPERITSPVLVKTLIGVIQRHLSWEAKSRRQSRLQPNELSQKDRLVQAIVRVFQEGE